MNHLDLFSGIGGFAYAVDQVWPGSTHTFCDNNLFCQKVLRKHWPESYIYGDIRTITDTKSQRDRRGLGEVGQTQVEPKSKNEGRTANHQNQAYDLLNGDIRTITNTDRTGSGASKSNDNSNRQTVHQGHEGQPQSELSRQIDILTGGFPCQPFSAAGKRRGTEDDRYLWPEMLRVIQLTKPTWIIGENVGGFVTWNEGMVLEQVCLDLENEGYQVQPFIIPACAVNTPHRRDRVWIIAQDTLSQRSGGGMEDNGQVLERQSSQAEYERPSWETNWTEVATELCGLDDGLPVELGEFKLTKAGHRIEQLKAYGNAIVPQVAIEIMKAIKLTIRKD